MNDVGYDPGVGADLYIVNGDFAEWAYADAGVPAYVVELTIGYGFEFPDDEDLVQTVFEDNLDFALSLGESALDPAHPVVPELAGHARTGHLPYAGDRLLWSGPDHRGAGP
jgi:hypothetical protein